MSEEFVERPELEPNVEGQPEVLAEEIDRAIEGYEDAGVEGEEFEQEGGQETSGEPKPQYTPEEIRELLDAGDFSAIDASRLSEEGKLLMRSMQAGLTPKLQEASEIRKQNEILQEELQAIREKIEAAQQQKEPETIYDYYDQDPEGTVQYIEANIQQMKASDPQANAYQIAKLESLLRDLERHEIKKLRSQTEQQKLMATAAQKLYSEIPNFAEVKPELEQFAKDMFGYTDAELSRLTDVQARGMDAIDTVVRIHRAYQKVNGKKNVMKKVVKTPPTRVETPTKQSGAEPSDVAKHFELRKKAARGEVSWQQVFLDLEP